MGKRTLPDLWFLRDMIPMVLMAAGAMMMIWGWFLVALPSCICRVEFVNHVGVPVEITTFSSRGGGKTTFPTCDTRDGHRFSRGPP